jgi:hypothetical protein
MFARACRRRSTPVSAKPWDAAAAWASAAQCPAVVWIACEERLHRVNSGLDISQIGEEAINLQ